MKGSGKVSSEIPKGGSAPKGGKQTSGATKHARMTTAAKVEGKTPSGMPKCGHN